MKSCQLQLKKPVILEKIDHKWGLALVRDVFSGEVFCVNESQLEKVSTTLFVGGAV